MYPLSAIQNGSLETSNNHLFISTHLLLVSEERMSTIISGEADQYGIPGLGENKQKPSTYQVSRSVN